MPLAFDGTVSAKVTKAKDDCFADLLLARQIWRNVLLPITRENAGILFVNDLPRGRGLEAALTSSL